MRFEDVQQQYYKLTKKEITKEEVLNNLLKTINEINNVIGEIETRISIAKNVLNKMYNRIENDCNFNENAEKMKITMDVLGKLVKSKTTDEWQKFCIDSIIRVFKTNIDNRSRQRNYNRRSQW